MHGNRASRDGQNEKQSRCRRGGRGVGREIAATVLLDVPLEIYAALFREPACLLRVAT